MKQRGNNSKKMGKRRRKQLYKPSKQSPKEQSPSKQAQKAKQSVTRVPQAVTTVTGVRRPSHLPYTDGGARLPYMGPTSPNQPILETHVSIPTYHSLLQSRRPSPTMAHVLTVCTRSPLLFVWIWKKAVTNEAYKNSFKHSVQGSEIFFPNNRYFVFRILFSSYCYFIFPISVFFLIFYF